MKHPDPATHDPSPVYLRSLIAKAGMSQTQAAAAIGVDARSMRYYLTEPKEGRRSTPASYPVQFALECLPATE